MKNFLYLATIIFLSDVTLGISSSLNSDFLTFKQAHNKHYKDAFEEAFRKGIFASNLAIINKHNKEHDLGEHSWKMGINQFSDLTHEEFMEMNTLKIPESSRSRVMNKLPSRAVADEIDWRDSGCVSSVKDQGPCGACWAFGAVASMEFACCDHKVGANQLSEQQLLDCDRSGSNAACMGGWYDTAWEYIIVNEGANSAADYPYRARAGTCKDDEFDLICTITGCVGGIHDFCEDNGLVGDEEELQKMLNGQPVTVAVDASLFQFYSSGILDCHSSHSLNHAVFAVGYTEDSWIVKNSWGTSWGETGYIRIGRGIPFPGNPCGIADYPAYAVAE